jgi:predicted Holliday junction resolvase-like endonuclease
MDYILISLFGILLCIIVKLKNKEPDYTDFNKKISKLDEDKLELVRSNQQAKDQIKQLESTYSLKFREFRILIEKLEQDLYNEEQSRKTTLSQKKSSEVRLGQIAEKLAPFLEDFPYNPEDATFLGQPIDYIIFDDTSIVFVEIKTGKSKLSAKQRHIRDLVKNKYVEWKEIRIK